MKIASEEWIVKLQTTTARSFACALAVVAACFVACGGDDGDGMIENPIGGGGSGGSSGSEDEDGGIEEPFPGFSGCNGKDDGTVCGPIHICLGETCLPSRCGDGVRAESEECDDGNESLGDECSPSCRATPESCGDGERNDESEECDDGNTVNDDACANSCTRNACGNARLDVGEECDDAEDDTCSDACLKIRCRNGRVDPGEECDDGNRINNDGCTNACIAVRCGDGTVYEGIEECDDGNTVESDMCSNDCRNVECGNNRIDFGEECDGNALPAGKEDSTCTAECTLGASLEACYECRERDDACTNFMGSGYNLVDSCFTTPPTGQDESFLARCSALSECITRSRCDVDEGVEVVATVLECFCGGGVTDPVDCATDLESLSGPCIDEYLDATGCGGNAEPIGCVINLAADITLPSGYADSLALCDQTYCAAECRAE